MFRYEQGHQNWPEPLVKRIGVLAKAWLEERAREHAVVVGGWASPNDPKLRDSGARRDGCRGGSAGAAIVTCVAVLCSAWLAVAVISEKA